MNDIKKDFIETLLKETSDNKIYWRPAHIYPSTEQKLQSFSKLERFLTYEFSEHNSYFFEFEEEPVFIITHQFPENTCYKLVAIRNKSITTLVELDEYQDELKKLIGLIERNSISKDAQYFMDEIIRYFNPDCIDG